MSERRSERILIVGGSGSGKSTFGKELGKVLDIEVHHLDKYFWKPGWVTTERGEWERILSELVTKESWIIEGNYARTFKMRAQYANKIYVFEFPTVKYIYGAFKRSFKTKMKIEKRTDMGDGCEEKWFDKEFYQWMWRFNKLELPKIYNSIDELEFDKNNLIIFKNRKEVKQYLKDLVVKKGTQNSHHKK